MISFVNSWENISVAASTVIICIYLTFQACTILKKQRRRRKWAAAGKDVVILHQFPRGKFVPNMSPFALKLETYLRMSGIPYECDFDEPFGPKGKTPWITLNEDEIGDSQICLELLNRKFNKDFSSHLTAEEKATARAFQIMTEEHLYWVGATHRWVYNKGRELTKIMTNLPFEFRIAIPFISQSFKSAAYKQGIGRHTQAEVVDIGIKDLRALSVFLGKKPFFMGETPTEMDCAIFGMLAQFAWNESKGSPFLPLFDGEFLNLKEYCFRMKQTFWPDWEHCLNPPLP